MKQLFKDKKYWKEMVFILLFGVLINIACFCMPMVGHCSNESALGSMPYNCIDFQEYQSCITDEDCQSIINYISSQKSQYQSVANYIPNWDGSDVVMEINDANNDWVWVTVFYKPTIDNSFTFNENYNFTENSFLLKATDSVMTVIYKPSNGSFGGLLFPSGLNVTIGGQSSSVSSYFGNYLPRYPFFYNGSPILNSQGKEVFISRVGNGIDIGDFTDLPPINELLNNIQNTWEPPSSTTGHALPDEPTENSNNTPFQDRLQMFNYIKDTINSVVGNLGYNLKNWFDNLIGKIVQGFNSVSSNIYNGFSTLMQNIKDFFGAKLDAIIDLLSQNQNETQEEINNALDNTSMHEDLIGLHTLVSDSLGVWSDTDTPSEFKIPLHLEQLPMLHVDKCQYIDVGLFTPLFPYLRSIMWCLLVYSVIYTVIDSIASYIGGGDE